MLKDEQTQRTEVRLSDSGEKAQILFMILTKTPGEKRSALCTAAEFSQLALGAQTLGMDPKDFKQSASIFLALPLDLGKINPGTIKFPFPAFCLYPRGGHR